MVLSLKISYIEFNKTFCITVPMNLDPKAKATLFGAIFLIVSTIYIYNMLK